MDTDKAKALEFAADCLQAGDSRADVAATLQDMFGVSRATAYRLCAAACQASGAAADAAAIVRRADGTIDLRAEIERQYAAAVAAEDGPAQLRWLNMLSRHAAA